MTPGAAASAPRVEAASAPSVLVVIEPMAGAIPLALASRLADLYGTTTDGLAGRRIDRRRPSLNGIPNER